MADINNYGAKAIANCKSYKGQENHYKQWKEACGEGGTYIDLNFFGFIAVGTLIGCSSFIPKDKSIIKLVGYYVGVAGAIIAVAYNNIGPKMYYTCPNGNEFKYICPPFEHKFNSSDDSCPDGYERSVYSWKTFGYESAVIQCSGIISDATAE